MSVQTAEGGLIVVEDLDSLPKRLLPQARMGRFSAPAGAGKELGPPLQRSRRCVEHQTVVGCTDSDILAGISKHRDDRFRLGRVDGCLEGVVLDTASFGDVGDLRQRAFDPLVAGGGLRL